jgi:hypothetical protein
MGTANTAIELWNGDIEFQDLGDGKLQLVMGFFDFAPNPAVKPTVINKMNNRFQS